MGNRDMNEEVKKIIDNYKRLYNLIFKLGVYILVLFIGVGFVLYADFNKDFNYDYDLGNEQIGYEKIDDGYKGDTVYLGNDVALSGIQAEIIRGVYKQNGNNLSSFHNIVDINGIILPFNIEISKNILSQLDNDGNSFEQFIGLYDELLHSNNVNVENDSLYKLNSPNQLKSIGEKNFVNYFGLSCLFSTKIFDKFCMKNVESFMNRFYQYDISENMQSFESIFTKLEKMDKKKELCDQLKNHINYSYKTNNNLKSLFERCGNNYIDYFNKISGFKTISDEFRLSDSYISDKVFDYEKLNNYKLISLQKYILKKSKNDNLNKNIIDSYLSFVEKFLIRHKIREKTKNIIYYYNNIYLNDIINNLKTNQQRSEGKTKLERLSNKVSEINEGNQVEGYKGLKDSIGNNDVIAYVDEQKSDNTSKLSSSVNTLSDLFGYFINNYDNISISSKKIRRKRGIVDVNSYINLTLGKDENVKNVEIPGIIRFKSSNSGYEFFVQNVSLPKNKDLQNTIKKYISKNEKVELNEIFDIMKSNLSLSSTSEVSLCKYLEDELSSKNKINLNDCNEKSINITKNIEDIKYKYTFNISGDEIESIDLPTDGLQSSFDEKLDNSEISGIEPVSNFVKNVLDADIKSGNEVSVSASDSISRRFDTLLNTDVKTIKSIGKDDGGNEYRVFFTLSSHKISVNVDLSDNYNLSSLILYLENQKFDMDGYNIDMVEGNSGEFVEFRKNTNEYLKSIDSKTYEKYLEEK